MSIQCRLSRSSLAPIATAPVAILLMLALLAAPATAHETDQFTLPPGREFADFSDHLTRFAYDAIAKGVERQNNRIKLAVDGKAIEAEIKLLQSGEELANAVNRQFPIALFLIEDLDKLTISDKIKPKYPGRIVGYKPKVGIRRNIESPLNPFKAWGCATINAYGIYFGTDKVGHFTDMGMHYYRGYLKARAAGKDENDAMSEALQLGTHGPIYSERGMLGLVTAGAYSNADLVANFMGMCFYRNLSEPVKLKGAVRPPMVVRDGHYWKMAPHVRPDSDFFSLFFSEHLNEALNPSFYHENYREKMRAAVREHRHTALARYTDRNGNVRSRDYFADKTEQLSTYWGFDYGHEGSGDQLITLADTCFAPAPDLSHPSARNDDGLTSVHWAAQSGDLKALRRLLENGGDANARVPAGKSIPAVTGDTPLHLAAAEGQIDVIRLLLASGADVTARNARGVTPLHRAVNNPDAAAVLCAAGAEVDAPDQVGRTPLHWASNDPQLAGAVTVLLDYGARPMPQDRDGLTPLHLAAQAASDDAIVALARAGADVNAADRFGVTALHLAAGGAGAVTTDLLLKAGAQANAQDTFGVTPLLVATRARQHRVVGTLLTGGGDPKLADAYGVSPLAVADRRGNDALAQLFQQPPPTAAPAAPAARAPGAQGSGGAAITAGETIAPGQ